MNNKIWFFGDSFTKGDGCIPNNDSPYYDDYPNKRGKIWTTLVSEHFKMKEMNCGESGASNTWILNTILDNLHLIDKNDYVIISDTRPSRFLIPRVHDGEISNFSPGQEEVWDFHIKNRKDAIKPLEWEDMKKTLINFTWYFQEEYIDLWENYYTNRFNNIIKFFEKNNIRNTFWSYKLWYERQLEFELIVDDIPFIKNEHWSWKGHYDFSNWIIYNNRNNFKKFI